LHPLHTMKDILPAIPIVVTVFVLACAYAGQYWAKKCYDELKAIREELKRRH
jgi:hypothetical protein